MIETVHLSTAYFPPIQYFSKIIDSQNTCIEIHEHYQRQTYRNRCHIYGANGIQALSIPIEKHKKDTLIKDIKIAYHTPWQNNHWRSIMSAYKSAPFFDHYSAILKPLFSTKETFLLDLNQKIMEVITKIIGLNWNPILTHQYTKDVKNDWRQGIHPKKQHSINDPLFNAMEYYQVFSDKHDFIANLSIIDLLFCEGNGTLLEIKKSIKTRI